MREKNRAAELELAEFLTDGDETDEHEEQPRSSRTAAIKATIRHGCVMFVSVRDGLTVHSLYATVRESGPEFELRSPMLWDQQEEPRPLTRDDALAAHTFLAPMHERDDIEKMVREVLEAEYVFEVGIEIPYEGLNDRKVFRKYSDARAHAEQLIQAQTRYLGYDGYDAVIQPLKLH